MKFNTSEIPSDVQVVAPENSQLPKDQQHFLLYIPWNQKYLTLVPTDFKPFFSEVLEYLHARTTDVHTAVCLSFLDEFIEKAEKLGNTVDRKVLALALILHDSGWSQMSEQEVAASLGVTGLALTKNAVAPKEKHAILGEKIARDILTKRQEELELSFFEVDLICTSILYHDKPEQVAGAGNDLSIETQLLVDLDHIWSFTHLNFWQDTLRKGVSPEKYVKNLENDLDTYFVTEIGKEKARELLLERKSEVERTL